MQSGAPSSVGGKKELVRTIVGLTAELQRLMAASGADAWMDLQNITVKQLKVMLILSQHGPETVTALARAYLHRDRHPGPPGAAETGPA
jgi:hypothetical protein